MKSQKEAQLLVPLLANFLRIRTNYHNVPIVGKSYTQTHCVDKDQDAVMISCEVCLFFYNVGLVMTQVFKVFKKDLQNNSSQEL